MPKDTSIKKVLVIGSGPIVIGQAAEFDYAGTQACRVLKQEGVETILVNSNPATIMTDNAMADAVYLEPLTTETIKRIILETQPDSLLAGLGGQTGLTIAMELDHEGFLKEHNVRLIGTNADAIDKAEDRQLFKDAMAKIGQPTIPSDTAHDIETCVAIANRIGYPVIVRPAFTLGGGGGGVAYNEEELREVGSVGLDYSPITQVLIEKYIFGWKEIEFEVMRDHKGTAITICSMENFDPVGIHTGDSIVVAPALTLADKEYQMLRSAALKIIEELGIEGGCNCQFALNPDSFEYAVIEVNPRVSRSSALASKATGYPIAKITAKIALGYTLDEIKNDVTGETFACFEPAVDYVVVKFPKWPFDKFHGASRKLGSQMKATGEVMSIAHTFEAALMKAVRGAEIKLDSLHSQDTTGRSLDERLASMDDLRLFTIFEALSRGCLWTTFTTSPRLTSGSSANCKTWSPSRPPCRAGSPSRPISRRRNTATLTRPWPAWRGWTQQPCPTAPPAIRWWTPARRNSRPKPRISTPPMTSTVMPGTSPGPAGTPSSSWGPAPFGSARALNLITAPSTVSRP